MRTPDNSTPKYVCVDKVSASDILKRFFFAALFCFFVAEAKAQENTQPDTAKLNVDKLLKLSFEDLMNVSVVTPTKSVQKPGRAPATVLVVTSEQIRLRGYRNLAEVLNDLPDFMITDKSMPQYYNTASIRGVFGQDHFVILMDGVRISSPTNEPLPLLENFPIYLAKQIEVVYGPGSALYGADAMGGVINILTRQPDGSEQIMASVTGGTQGYANASTVFNYKLKNDVTLTLAGQYSYDAQPDFSKIYKKEYDLASHKTGIFNTQYGPITPQGAINPEYEAPIKTYNAYTALGKGGFSMKLLHHYSEVPSSSSLSTNHAVYNKDVFYGQGLTTVSANQTIGAGNFRSLSSFVGSFYKVNPLSNFRNLYGGMERGYKYSTGSMLKMEEQLHYAWSKDLNITGGLTYEIFQSLPKSPELQSPVSNHGAVSGILLNSVYENNPSGIEAKFFPLAYTNVGGYLQAEYSPLTEVSVTAGVRYDNNSRFGSTINPRVGAVFNPWGNTTIKMLYGTAYWAPSPSTSFESYGSFYSTDNGTTYQSAFWQLPNPDLGPMTSRSLELSITQNLSKKVMVTFVAYRTVIDDLIEDVNDNGNTNLYNNYFLGYHVDYIQVPFNRGSQENYGGHLKIQGTFNIGRLELLSYNSVSYLEGKLFDHQSNRTSVEQPAMAPWQFRTGLDGKINAYHFSVRLLAVGKQRTYEFADAAIPGKRATLDGYALMNVSAGYTLGNATFFVKAENALNQKFKSAVNFAAMDLDGSYQNPARVMVGVRAGF
ncbi:TonB-dependent receptor [Fulvivirgaceae bacterium PWU4]|uniref:TonB-dependent receptor n=1 Tax=Chryseosolibacter histidini TaxID=2782349 RepID=A0AAP2DI06_9BACT|nr:TonB-dependent receptor [Chryseosolibacter histidini]MBT1696753.1 TonB-dependent receptor [Chryseosolibacter histidini]